MRLRTLNTTVNYRFARAYIAVVVLVVLLVSSLGAQDVRRSLYNLGVGAVATFSGNNASQNTLSANGSAIALLSQPTGGVDETLAASPSWAAFQITANSTTIGSVAIGLRRDVGVTAGTVRAFFFTDSAGSPGTDRSDTSTGLPIILDVRQFATTYNTYELRLPQNTLNNVNNGGCIAPCGATVNATKYWVVLNTQGVSGGNVYLNRNSNVVSPGVFATAADSAGAPGAWSVVTNKTPVYTVYGDSGAALQGNSQNRDAVLGVSNAGFAGRFVSTDGTGVKADSTFGYGNAGTSIYNFGMRASSNFNSAFQAVSQTLFGGLFQGVTGGIQAFCTGAGCTSVQAITGATGLIYTGLNAAFVNVFQADYLGNVFGAGFYSSAAPATVASAGTIALTTQITLVSGTAAIVTITVPTGCGVACTVTFVPTGIYTTTTAGNIRLASTAIVGRTMFMTWDGTKWDPSY